MPDSPECSIPSEKDDAPFVRGEMYMAYGLTMEYDVL